MFQDISTSDAPKLDEPLEAGNCTGGSGITA